MKSIILSRYWNLKHNFFYRFSSNSKADASESLAHLCFLCYLLDVCVCVWMYVYIFQSVCVYIRWDLYNLYTWQVYGSSKRRKREIRRISRIVKHSKRGKEGLLNIRFIFLVVLPCFFSSYLYLSLFYMDLYYFQ